MVDSFRFSQIGYQGVKITLWEPNESIENQRVVLFVHGLEERFDVWSPLHKYFVGEYRVCLLELPWSGRERVPWPQILPSSEWLQYALTEFQLEPEAIISHSLGANATLELLYKQKLPTTQAVVLVSPFFCNNISDFTWSYYQDCLSMFNHLMREGIILRQGRREVAPDIVNAVIAKVLDAIGPQSFIEFMRMFFLTPLLPINQIETPVLITGGTLDIGATPKQAHCLGSALNTSVVNIIDGAGHYCMLSHVEETYSVIENFLTLELSGKP